MKVDALFNALNEQVSVHEETLAFINWEFVITVILSFLFLGALLFLTGVKVNNPGDEVQRLLNQIKIGCGIYILLCFLFFISPYRIKDLFPGFELLSEDIKWYDKYANLISVGLVFIGMIGAAYRYLTRLFTLVPINPKQESAAEKKSDNTPAIEE